MGKRTSVTVEQVYTTQKIISPQADEIIFLYVKDGDGMCGLNGDLKEIRGTGLFLFDTPFHYAGNTDTALAILRLSRQTLGELSRRIFFADGSRAVAFLLDSSGVHVRLELSPEEYALVANEFEGLRLAAVLGQSEIQYIRLFSLLRLLEQQLSASVEPDWTKQQILRYIHSNIQLPEALKIKQIAAVFRISEQYFSAFFRRTYGCSYKDYIDACRFEIIERKLIEKGASLKDLVVEFGFTDASHLSKYFKKMKGVSLMEVVKEK